MMVCGCMGVAGAHATASGIMLQTLQHFQAKLRSCTSPSAARPLSVHCLVLTPDCHCRSRSRPFAVLLLLQLLLLLLLAASLMRPPTLLFLLLTEMLLDVTAGICVDDTVHICLHKRQHCQLCSLPDSIMPLC